MAAEDNDWPVADRLCGGRFTETMDRHTSRFSDSLPIDRAFGSQDIVGSIAFARANVKTGILTETEAQTIVSGLERIESEWESQSFQILKGDENIHTANERRLSEIIGKELAGKLHTGRCPNDQVATDIRLWLRKELNDIGGGMLELLSSIAKRAELEMDYIMPGYAHLQSAQPVRWSQWLLSHAFFFTQDAQRLRQLVERVNLSPLGCGALSGNTFNIDRAAMAKELHFAGLVPNSMAAVTIRDPILEAMQWSSMLMLHISRISEDLIMYSMAGFNFVRLTDNPTSESLLNPRVIILDKLREKCGRVLGGTSRLMMSIDGLPSTFTIDWQKSLESALGTIKTVRDSITILSRVVENMTTCPENMRAALTPNMLATDLAEWLVRKGLPFRETHQIAGRVVALAEDAEIPMDQLTLAQLQSVDPRFDEHALEVFDYEHSVERKSAAGGTSRAAVKEQIKDLWAYMDNP